MQVSCLRELIDLFNGMPVNFYDKFMSFWHQFNWNVLFLISAVDVDYLFYATNLQRQKSKNRVEQLIKKAND